MSMHAIALLARPERADATAHAHATLSLMSVWTAAYGKALMLKQPPRAVDWECGSCAHLTTTTIALMRSFISPQACVQAITQSTIDKLFIDKQNAAESASAALLEQNGNFLLNMLACCGEIFTFLFQHALAYLPLSAPTAAQEFLLDEIMNEWRASKASRQGSQEFWDVANNWEIHMMAGVRESMAVQRCVSVQESLLLSVPIFLRYTETCIHLLQTGSTSTNSTHAQNLYIMRGMSCPCVPCHQTSPSCRMDVTAPLLLRAVLSLARALSEGLILADLCMKSCVTSRTTIVDHRKSDGDEPAPFRSRCTLLLASRSAWSTMLCESGITKSVTFLLRDASLWLPPPPVSSTLPPPAAAAALQIANSFEDQKRLYVHVFHVLLSCAVQTLQHFHDLDDGARSSIIEHLDTEMKCLGPTYLQKNAFCTWASIRYPEMDNFIFQPHSLTKHTKQRSIDVLFATQAGFLCALHADAVLAPELQLAGALSMCSSDYVISLSEIHLDGEGSSSSSFVREQCILFSDIVERLLGSACPASGAAAAFQHADVLTRVIICRAVYVIDNGLEMKVTSHSK
jgi:hypothetical protein